MTAHLIMTRLDGQGLVEYALIILFVALAVVTALGAFGVGLNNYIQNISDSL